jgi:hypothetical protein
VRVSYHQHLVALGRHLDATPAQNPVVITSMYPGEFHDPYTMEVTLRRQDLELQWVNGQHALFFPHNTARLYTEAHSAPLPPLRTLLEGYIEPHTILTFKADDLIPEIKNYIWESDKNWTAITTTLMKNAFCEAGDPPPSPYNAQCRCPIEYADTVALAGYTIAPPVASPGNTVNIITAWDIQNTPTDELILFVHLLNAEGKVVDQRDRLDAPSWQWQPGDRFVQTYQFTLPTDISPGTYGFAIGFYQRADSQRLSIITEHSGQITRALLPFDIKSTTK